MAKIRIIRPRKPKTRTYEVSLRRTLTLSTSVQVEAADEEDAEAKALELTRHEPITWDIYGKNYWQEEGDDTTADAIDEV